MNTKLTLLAALLLAGASQAALAQEHDQDRWHDPGQSQPRPAPQAHAAPAPAPAPQPHAAPAPGPAPQVAPGGPGRGEHRGNGGEAARFQPQPPPQAAAPSPAPGPQPRGDHRWAGDRDRFAPGATADGDRRWDRRDAPREVTPPGVNAERGWDRQHDGHGPSPGYAERVPHDGRWDRDHRGPPPNWQRWDHNRFPPVYVSQQRYRIGAYHRPYGWFVRSWVFGDFLPGGWYGPNYWVDDFWDYDLPYPPPGFHWVRVGDDALLVDDYNGRVVQVVRDLFW
jgi:Ni/Co efflux regulator RcnB